MCHHEIDEPRRPAVLLALALTALVPSAIHAQGNSRRPGGETAGSNLSFPVIWSDGVTEALRGSAGHRTELLGAWWYWWGIDPVTETPMSCAPDPDDPTRCDDGIPFTATGPYPGSGTPGETVLRSLLQKDLLNTWQAWNQAATGRVIVDWIDWGDNLESVDWYLSSQVRTEVVLIEDLVTFDEPSGSWEPGLVQPEYTMLHTYGWGIDEMHGLAVDSGIVVAGPGTQATVYSHCARLMIQKLHVDRKDERLAALVWIPRTGWTEPPGYPEDLVGAPIYDGAVWEGGDGPGYYSAEINIKGKVIYGYTWNVRKNNDGPGDYRITFALEDGVPGVTRNTWFDPSVTGIVLAEPSEESTEAEDEGGAVGVVDCANQLTYIDVRILERSGGGGKKPKKK